MEDSPQSAGTVTNTSGSTKKGDGAGVTFGDGIEKFSGLRVKERRVRPTRWEEMMSGRRFIPFDQLTRLESIASETSKDAVLIGVVYEKSLAKTGASGNRYCHWSFTDLSFPQPKIMTLVLLGQAFETWEGERESAIANGSVFAVLNPILLPKRSNEVNGQEGRAAIKISYGTQLVCLGVCPSLGHCQCKKKDGMKCSMPCDLDRGPLVCYYHSVQQAAQNANQWKKRNAASGPAPARSDGLFVMEAPRARPALPKNGQRAGSSGGLLGAPSQRSTKPVAASAAARPQAGTHAKPPGGALDEATRRLLAPKPGRSMAEKARPVAEKPRPVAEKMQHGVAEKTRPVAAAAVSSASHVGSAPSLHSCDGRAPATPARAGGSEAETLQDEAPSAAMLPGLGSGVGILRQAHEEKERRQKEAIRRLMAQGTQDPDPNHPLNNAGHRPHWTDIGMGSASARYGPAGSAPAQSRPAVAAAAGRSTVSASSSGTLSRGAKREREAAAGQPERKTAAAQKRLEAEYGTRIAMQLRGLDPRKDLARKQGSRFQSVVEEERAAKRRRQLAELERQDAMAEKMEALMEITVQAWRCPECNITTESFKSKAVCEQQGHRLSQVEAKKTHWECKNCKWAQFVLNRDIPAHCVRCNGMLWHQVPLQRARRAAMERDMLLPRGEELPFLNSIPKPFKEIYSRVKEADDEYAGL